MRWNRHEPNQYRRLYLSVYFSNSFSVTLRSRLVARLALIASIIDLWNSNARQVERRLRNLRPPSPSRSLARPDLTVVSCFFYCRFIISCRWSRDCELSLGAHTSYRASLSRKRYTRMFGLAPSGAGACRTRCRASMFWEVHPLDVPTVHLRPTSLRKKQTRALCWRKSTSAGRAEWLIQLW